MPVGSSYITDVNVDDFKKFGKNYAYVIQTTWSDGMKFELYRKYGDFFTFQDLLLKMFPKEAGKHDSTDRKIPYLPTVDNIFKLFGRTNSESVMKERITTINYYCKTVLLTIGEHIGRSSVVIDFFQPTPNDKQHRRLGRPATLHPQKIPAGDLLEDYVLLADYEAEPGKSQLSAKADELVIVVRKDESGWSLCNKKSTAEVGWVPSSFLKRKVDTEEIELGFAAAIPEKQDIIVEENDTFEKYHSICEYDAQSSGQISFPEGAEMIVIDKDDDGWWFVDYNGKEGWAPSSYLEPIGGLPEDELDEVHTQEQGMENDAAGDTSASSSKGGIFYAKQDYLAEDKDELSFDKGAEIEIINKSITGWWTGRLNGKMGVVPSTFMSSTKPEGEKPLTSDGVPASPAGNQTEGPVKTELQVGGAKFHKPPPRRKTVRHTIMLKKHRVKS